MYKQFFGLKERPFHLTPNPAFLYLSKSHEEALAHLTYALSQGDGFVEITGEVGAGKTTLCRAFLENLDESTNAAYIFNPKLDAIQLLKTINDEFGVDSSADTAKELIDNLNAFLMQSKADGKKTILLIDEAQNLTPSVLEQLRLLSNLETTTDKLLQIILVGQPELGIMLDSYELRQLGQRITLSCFLAPLNFKETKEYINHRLHIAASKQTIRFDNASLKRIHRYSQGVPRRINIVCDRVLLTAFGLDSTKITGKITKMAIRELSGRNAFKKKRRPFLKYAFAALILISAISIGVAIYSFQSITNSDANAPGAPNEKKHANQTTALASANGSQPLESANGAATDVKNSAQALGELILNAQQPLTRQMAVQTILSHWQIQYEKTEGLDIIEDDLTFFQTAMKSAGLSIHTIDWNFALVEKLNLPLIIRIRVDERDSSEYLVLVRIKNHKAMLQGGVSASSIEIDVNALTADLIDTVFIPWKNYRNLKGVIPREAPDDSLLALKVLLRDIGFPNIPINTDYDRETEDAVKRVQLKHGLPVDGVVGVLTKIILYNEARTFAIPHLKNPLDRS